MRENYTIKEISEMFNITTNKIRFYEKKGLLLPIREEDNKYRKFNDEDIIRLQSILLYRSIGLSIDAIKGIQEMIRVLKKDGSLIIGDLMFESKEAEEEILKSLSEEQIYAIKDEYYSYIDLLKYEFEKYNKAFEYERIDEFIYIIKVS